MSEIPCQISEIRQALIDLSNAVKGRPYEDATVQISATMPLVLDYKGRYFITIFTPNALVLSLEDWGTISIPAGSWADISFPAGTRVFATNQSTTVPILLRCTDVK
jgi:hypothetical protein